MTKATDSDSEVSIAPFGKKRESRAAVSDWIKVKNRKHPAYRRVQDQF